MQSRPVAVHESYIDLILRDGADDVVIGRVRAEFDYSQVPEEFRSMVLSTLASGGQSWMVGAVAQRHDYRVIERRPRPVRVATPVDTGGAPEAWWEGFKRKMVSIALGVRDWLMFL